MSSPKPLNFAKALRAKPPADADAEQATKEQSQLSTASDSQHATPSPSPIADASNIAHATEPATQTSTTTESQLAARSDIQQSALVETRIPPASPIATEPVESVSKQAARRKADSHRRRPSDSRKGDRHRGDRVPFNNRLSSETIDRIKHFLVDHHLEQQEFAELAAIHFMDSVDSQQTAAPDSRQAHDERDVMIMYKTSPTIINLYIQYNPENRWKPADDYLGVTYNDKDIRLIECGIIQTQFNAKFKRIRSFEYYRNEIDAQFDMPLESNTIDIMLNRARRSWAMASGQGS